jgi:hypothetical protein
MYRLIFLLLINVGIFAHDTHPMLEVDSTYKIQGGADERITMRLLFENETDKKSAEKKLEGIKKAITFVAQSACYDRQNARGQNLLKHDLLYHFSIGNFKVHDLILRR